MWGATVEYSATLQATSLEICAESLSITVRAREARGGLRLCGGSDLDQEYLTVLVVSVILERPTCLTCIAAKVDAPALTVVRAIERIGETVNVQVVDDERCRMCGSTLGPTYSLPR